MFGYVWNTGQSCSNIALGGRVVGARGHETHHPGREGNYSLTSASKLLWPKIVTVSWVEILTPSHFLCKFFHHHSLNECASRFPLVWKPKVLSISIMLHHLIAVLLNHRLRPILGSGRPSDDGLQRFINRSGL